LWRVSKFHVPELLFLDTFGIGGEVGHQVLDFIALLLSIGVNDFCEVSHQTEVRAH
jgi:lipid-binding SYLF domain-containing protein